MLNMPTLVFTPCSIINGVKDMDGFRMTMNLSLVNSNTSNDSNSSSYCGGSDETEQAVLVSEDHAGSGWPYPYCDEYITKCLLQQLFSHIFELFHVN